MIIYTDENGNIFDVGENRTGNPSLKRVEINDDENPFKDWSKFRICAYRCTVNDGHVTMMTPRINSILIDSLNGLGTTTDANEVDISDVREAIMELYEMMEV